MKTKKRKPTLKELIKAASAAGAKVSVSLEPQKMPLRLPGDPEVVTLLIEESERISKLGNKWLAAETPNQIAAHACLQQGWAFALAAAWLRCKLKGEVK